MEVLVKDFIENSRSKLDAAGISDASVDVWILLEEFADIKRSDYYVNQDVVLSDEELEILNEAIDKRVKRIPLQHITGHQEFMGLDFKVNDKVLVPRQDTESLVEEVVKYIKDKDLKVLDMCTGSGCIAISVKDMCENTLVTASDISKDAIEVAMENAELNFADVEFIESDLFDEVTGKFDVIVSNPPYIRTSEIENLMDEVRVYDPKMALDGDSDGLKFYRAISKDAIDYLKTNGMIFYEIGYDQGNDVKNILEDLGYVDIKVIKDLSGKDRVVSARKE